LDREWYLTFQQYRLKLIHMLDNLIELLASNPDFRHFLLDGQTIILEDYLHMRPEREAQLREFVQKGQLLIGPWYILPDEFLVSPEATVRNLLQGERTSRRFGAKMRVGYIPDSFGHIGQLPQILRGFSIDTSCVQRGLSDEPAEFGGKLPMVQLS
jgi:mannosylglycerate hydrolase